MLELDWILILGGDVAVERDVGGAKVNDTGER